MKKKKRTRFEYRQRGSDSVDKRANQSGGMFDSFLKSDFTTFKPKDGANRIRFLPPTWDDAEHYGLDIYVHYDVGSDRQSYLCHSKMGSKKECPICAEKRKADRSGDSEYAAKLNPTKRVLVWLIDCDDPGAGPQLWTMPWTIDRDINILATDKRTKETLFIDSPEDGYCVEFTRTGAKRKTKYVGIKIDRKPSSISDDEDEQSGWLEFIQENPLPEVLQFFDPERIAQVASGQRSAEDDDDEDEDDEPKARKSKAKSRRDDDDDDDDDEDDEESSRPTKRPTKSRSKKSSDDDEDEDDDEPKQKKKCKACGGSGRNSKGGYCVCDKGKRLAMQDDEDDDDDEDED